MNYAERKRKIIAFGEFLATHPDFRKGERWRRAETALCNYILHYLLGKRLAWLREKYAADNKENTKGVS